MIVKTSCRKRSSVAARLNGKKRKGRNRNQATRFARNRTTVFLFSFRREPSRNSQRRGSLMTLTPQSRCIFMNYRITPVPSNSLEVPKIPNLLSDSTLCHWSVPRQTTFLLLRIFSLSFSSFFSLLLLLFSPVGTTRVNTVSCDQSS